MKRNISIVLLILILSSCGKDLLDKQPYISVPVASSIKTVDEMSAAVNGVYGSMKINTISGRSIPIMGDLMADNVYISSQNSGRYLTQNNYSYINSSAETNGIWRDLYAVIKNANNVINAEVPSSPLTDATRDQLRGEAITLRAWSYFELIRHFGKPYTVDPNSPGVPIVTSFDQNSKPNRNKVSEVYTQIINDLNQAYTLMTVTNKTSAYINKYVAKGLLAKVYLYMGDWQKAKDAALDVVTNGGYTIVSAANYVAYWKNPAPIGTKVETMFELSLDAATNNGTSALAYLYDPAGYGDMLATNDLNNLYTATDIRKSFIIPGTRGGSSVLIVNKYQNGTNTDKDDVKMMRISEIALILAEAYARLNDETNARAQLNSVATKRDPSFTGYTSTGAQLIEDIITERRKELAFEGERFHDLQRLNRVITRTPQHPASAQTITTDNFRRIQPIPLAETDANPNIGQNPGY